jgi:hypothetical protein
MRTIYAPAEYYQRALNCLGWVTETVIPARTPKLTGNNIATLARIILKLGIRDVERVEFWRFMRRVLADHRGKFEEAMSFAVTGYHFRKLTEAYCE